MNSSETASIVSRTVVLVVGLYDLLLLVPLTQWLKVHAFSEFGSALPAPTRFVVDAQWLIVLAVVVSHSVAAWLSHRRFGRVACVVLILLSALFTAFWFWAMRLPFFAIAGAIK